jgi:excisionase family DNA binding protein
MIMEKLNKGLTQTEAAIQLGISKPTLTKLIEAKEIKTITYAFSKRILQKEIDNYKQRLK